MRRTDYGFVLRDILDMVLDVHLGGKAAVCAAQSRRRGSIHRR
jgi:hypothetical protein